MDDRSVPPPPQPGGFNWGLAVVPLVAIGLLLWWMGGRKPVQNEQEAMDDKAFNVQEVPKDPERPPAPPSNYVSDAEREAQKRLGTSGSGLSSLLPETDRVFKKDPKNEEDDERAHEREVIRKYDGMIRDEQAKLNVITRRYYKKEPIVREVDKAFGSLPRYMAVKARYEQDRDAYAFARGAIALPEVRKTIYKYALNANVWRVTVGMMLEGMKQKPEKPVYDEMKRFFTEDKQMAVFVTDLSGYLIPRMGSLLPQAIKPGQDMRPLQELAKDLNVNGAGAPSVPAQTGGRGHTTRPRP